jgi:hypothetical protein
VAEEQAQHADVEQDVAQRSMPVCSSWLDSTSSVLLAVEADQAAEQEDRQRDVGIDPE